MHLGDVSEFAVDAERAADFAVDLADRRGCPGGRQAWRLTLVSLRSTFSDVPVADRRQSRLQRADYRQHPGLLSGRAVRLDRPVSIAVDDAPVGQCQRRPGNDQRIAQTEPVAAAHSRRRQPDDRVAANLAASRNRRRMRLLRSDRAASRDSTAGLAVPRALPGPANLCCPVFPSLCTLWPLGLPGGSAPGLALGLGFANGSRTHRIEGSMACETSSSTSATWLPSVDPFRQCRVSHWLAVAIAAASSATCASAPQALAKEAAVDLVAGLRKGARARGHLLLPQDVQPGSAGARHHPDRLRRQLRAVRQRPARRQRPELEGRSTSTTSPSTWCKVPTRSPCKAVELRRRLGRSGGAGRRQAARQHARRVFDRRHLEDRAQGISAVAESALQRRAMAGRPQLRRLGRHAALGQRSHAWPAPSDASKSRPSSTSNGSSIPRKPAR